MSDVDSDVAAFGKGLATGIVAALIIAAAVTVHLLSKLEMCRDTHGPNTTTHQGKCVKVVSFEKE